MQLSRRWVLLTASQMMSTSVGQIDPYQPSSQVHVRYLPLALLQLFPLIKLATKFH